MQAVIRDWLDQASKLSSQAESRQAAIGLFRIILQHACLSVTEWLIDNRQSLRFNEGQQLEPLDLYRLRSPSDGTLLDILIEFIVIAENEGWSGISRPVLRDRVDRKRPCARLSSRPLGLKPEDVFRGFIELRNDGVEGHGIPGEYDPEAELDAVLLATECLAPLLPRLDTSGIRYILETPGGARLNLKLLRPVNGHLICYRHIRSRADNKCIVTAQEQLALFERRTHTYETQDVLGASDLSRARGYDFATTYSAEWSPLTLLPDRLTQHFTGRIKELVELEDWLDDLDSRACMLIGDGGIGKTTLAIEFVHRLLNGQVRTEWRPEIITFYTAKQTRWGLEGLETIRTTPVNIADVALEIRRSLDPKPLGREWLAMEPDRAIMKLAGYLHDEWGIRRQDHLIILDNTETMARNYQEVEDLKREIRGLARHVGKVLLTSRRREAVEARHIEISPLDEDESVELLRSRADELQCQPILQAGLSTLRKYSRKLGNKPLVLEVFVQAANVPQMSLDRAFQRVQRMKNEDLGEFLFSDAWNRLSKDMRHLLLLMARVSDVHDEISLKLCCEKTDVLLSAAEDSLEASYGIASITKVGGHLQVIFNHDFLRFCQGRTVQIAGENVPTSQSIESIRRRHRDFMDSSSRRVHDRVSSAFRHPYARAARVAFDDGRYEDCELFYEEAIGADPENGLLFDRFAYFLFSQRRLPEALLKATQATSLAPRDPESWFTRGMIEGRLGRTDEALTSLRLSEQLGKSRQLCLLQQAYAYLNDTPPNKALAHATLKEAQGPNTSAGSQGDPYYYRTESEIERVLDRMSRGHDLRWRPS